MNRPRVTAEEFDAAITADEYERLKAALKAGDIVRGIAITLKVERRVVAQRVHQ